MKHAVLSLLVLALSALTQGSSYNVLPTKKDVPLTTASFCAGVENVLKVTKQDFKPEIAALCTGATPTALFATILAAPYLGTGTRRVTEIKVGDAASKDDVQIFITYSMRFAKGTVPILLKEEPYLATASKYEEKPGDTDGLKVSYKFLPPPLNLGDSDTAFQVEQLTSHAGNNVDFSDKSKHDLRLYRMHPDNFEFLMAVRTLAAPTAQFKRAVAVRGVMTDPTNPANAYSLTVINLVMNGRNANNNVIDKFMDFIKADMASLYTFINKP